MHEGKRVFLAMGKASPHRESVWQGVGGFDHYQTLDSAAPTGRRFGSRVFGLGYDSLVLAAQARMKFGRKARYVCANPWTAVALRALGVRSFSVVGIYAVRGGKSWKLLRWAIGSNRVLTLVDIETVEWNSDGGNAQTIRYGNTFGYPQKNPTTSRPLSIFVGGTSDRDQALLERLVDEVKGSDFSVHLVIADGTGPRRMEGANFHIEYKEKLSNPDFGTLMSESDIVFLPITNSTRAAGHMVTVGALECGIKVLTSDSPGMSGYIDGTYVSAIRGSDKLLEQLRLAAQNVGPQSPSEVRQYWSENFSLEVYADTVRRSLNVE